MEAVRADTALTDLEEAVQELSTELARLGHNIEAITEYQTSVLQVTKVLCSWMSNVEALAQHRKRLNLTSEPVD